MGAGADDDDFTGPIARRSVADVLGKLRFPVAALGLVSRHHGKRHAFLFKRGGEVLRGLALV